MIRMTNVKCPKCNHEWEDDSLTHEDEIQARVEECNADSAEQVNDLD